MSIFSKNAKKYCHVLVARAYSAQYILLTVFLPFQGRQAKVHCIFEADVEV